MRRRRQTATHRKHCVEYQTNTETMADSDNSALSAASPVALSIFQLN